MVWETGSLRPCPYSISGIRGYFWNTVFVLIQTLISFASTPVYRKYCAFFHAFRKCTKWGMFPSVPQCCQHLLDLRLGSVDHVWGHKADTGIELVRNPFFKPLPGNEKGNGNRWGKVHSRTHDISFVHSPASAKHNSVIPFHDGYGLSRFAFLAVSPCH